MSASLAVASYWFELYIGIAWLVRLAMAPVILRRQMAPGASMAWLGIIFIHPYIGTTLYLFLGERRLGPYKIERHKEVVAAFRSSARAAERQRQSAIDLPLRLEPMVRQAERICGLPVVGGNEVEFIGDAAAFIDRLVAEIDSARETVHLLYYIFERDQTGRRVADAVRRAAARGVACRLLLDGMGSRGFFRLDETGWVLELRAAGAHVNAALPVDFLRRRLARMDLRNHRKLAIIDGRVAYVGSHNIVDPDYGGRRGAPWIDISGRFIGSIVAELAGVFAEDWAFETGESLAIPAPAPCQPDCGASPMQAVPTGPTEPGTTYRRVLLAAVQSAQRELILTTPYFVPDDPTIVALQMAAERGVDVKLLVPRQSDNRWAALAGNAQYTRLMASGVKILRYRPGLLHAKTITVDDTMGVFGSANLDVRSFNLNFELSLILYGREATHQLRTLQLQYAADSDSVEPAEWAARGAVIRYVEQAVSLFSPLL